MKNWEVGGARDLEEGKDLYLQVFILYKAEKFSKKRKIWVSVIPAYSYCHGLRGGGTGTDNLRLQPVGLEHVQEGIAGRHRPWNERRGCVKER